LTSVLFIQRLETFFYHFATIRANRLLSCQFNLAHELKEN